MEEKITTITHTELLEVYALMEKFLKYLEEYKAKVEEVPLDA